METMKIDLPILKCNRCGTRWAPRIYVQGKTIKYSQPRTCPAYKCRSPNWNRERK